MTAILREKQYGEQLVKTLCVIMAAVLSHSAMLPHDATGQNADPSRHSVTSESLTATFWKTATRGNDGLAVYDQLVTLLADESPDIRRKAAICLALMTDRAAETAPVLIKHCETEPDPQTRTTLYFALALLGKESRHPELVLPHFISVIRQNDDRSTGSALRALHILGPMADPAADVVTDIFFETQAPSPFDDNWWTAAKTLIAFRPRPADVLPRFTTFLQELDWSSRINTKRVEGAILVIACYGDAADEYAELLVQSFQHPAYDENLPGYAMLPVGLRDLLKTTQRIPGGLLEVTRHDNFFARAQAAEILGVIISPEPEVIARLREMAASDPSIAVRVHAAASLIESGANIDIGWSLLLTAYRSEAPLGAETAVDAMARLPDITAQTLPLLVSRLDAATDSGQPAPKVCETLRKLAELAKSTLPALERHLAMLSQEPETNRIWIEFARAAITQIRAASGPEGSSSDQTDQ
ncbi:MAG: HEAT repeat domain-containing protein [Planctomycetota bacterium]|nr:MAG: HEAT repeat domain-containing protein [Planctomycetota bacterium]